MDKIKLFKFLIIFFISLNFITLISGYFFYIDFSNSQKNFYTNQIDVNLRKEIIISNNKKSLNLDFVNLTKNLNNLQFKIDDLSSQIVLLEGGSKNSKNIDVLILELGTLKKKEASLITKRDLLNNQLIKKISKQSRKLVVSTVTSAS